MDCKQGPQGPSAFVVNASCRSVGPAAPLFDGCFFNTVEQNSGSDDRCSGLSSTFETQ